MDARMSGPERRDEERRGLLRDYLVREWPQVHVAALETPATGAQVNACARARVDLGRLSPADVLVELVRTDETEAPRRMWSAWGSGDGNYVFEATLPAGVPSPGARYAVCVRPNPARVGEAPVDAVTGPSETCD